MKLLLLLCCCCPQRTRGVRRAHRLDSQRGVSLSSHVSGSGRRTHTTHKSKHYTLHTLVCRGPIPMLYYLYYLLIRILSSSYLYRYEEMIVFLFSLSPSPLRQERAGGLSHTRHQVNDVAQNLCFVVMSESLFCCYVIRAVSKLWCVGHPRFCPTWVCVPVSSH
jgi:hypothetical protein